MVALAHLQKFYFLNAVIPSFVVHNLKNLWGDIERKFLNSYNYISYVYRVPLEFFKNNLKIQILNLINQFSFIGYILTIN